MHLDPGGHPLHTRALTVTVRQRDDGLVGVDASLLDLRKRVYIPVGGDLQSSGIIHHMLLDAIVDPGDGRVVSIEGRQPSVAFEPSALTAGESCRDPLGAVTALAGARCDGEWSARIRETVGGPRGCFHMLSLTHFLGGTVAWALEQERARFGTDHARPAGQRIFRRDLIIDGMQHDDRALTLCPQLVDLHFTAADGIGPAMDRFAASLEFRGVIPLDATTVAVTDARVAERRRTAENPTAPWVERTDVAERVRGVCMLVGATAALLDRFPLRGDDAPVVDTLLMAPPALIQVFAATHDDWPGMARRDRWVVGMSGREDSCYMWRRDGALAAARSSDDPDIGSGRI